MTSPPEDLDWPLMNDNVTCADAEVLARFLTAITASG